MLRTSAVLGASAVAAAVVLLLRRSRRTKEPAVLGYVALRGLAEPIKLLHAFLGVPLEELNYGKPTLPRANRPMAEYMSTKHELAEAGMALPNTPWYVDDTVKLTEAAAILRHVCERHAPRLLEASGFPTWYERRARVDQLVTYLFYVNNLTRAFHYGYLPQTRTREAKEADGRTGSLYIARATEAETVCEMAAVSREQVLDAFAAGAVGNPHDGPFLFGETITLADFVLYEHIMLARCHCPQLIDGPPRVLAFCAAIEKLPGVRAYLASADRVAVPINAPFANFGASTDAADPFRPGPEWTAPGAEQNDATRASRRRWSWTKGDTPASISK